MGRMGQMGRVGLMGRDLFDSGVKRPQCHVPSSHRPICPGCPTMQFTPDLPPASAAPNRKAPPPSAVGFAWPPSDRQLWHANPLTYIDGIFFGFLQLFLQKSLYLFSMARTGQCNKRRSRAIATKWRHLSSPGGVPQWTQYAAFQ